MEILTESHQGSRELLSSVKKRKFAYICFTFLAISLRVITLVAASHANTFVANAVMVARHSQRRPRSTPLHQLTPRTKLK